MGPIQQACQESAHLAPAGPWRAPVCRSSCYHLHWHPWSGRRRGGGGRGCCCKRLQGSEQPGWGFPATPMAPKNHAEGSQGGKSRATGVWVHQQSQRFCSWKPVLPTRGLRSSSPAKHARTLTPLHLQGKEACPPAYWRESPLSNLPNPIVHLSLQGLNHQPVESFQLPLTPHPCILV